MVVLPAPLYPVRISFVYVFAVEIGHCLSKGVFFIAVDSKYCTFKQGEVVYHHLDMMGCCSLMRKVTIVTSNVKWSITIHDGLTLGYVEVTIVTSNVKWCITITVSSHWVTVMFSDEVPYHLQVIVVGSWSASTRVFTVGVALVLCY